MALGLTVMVFAIAFAASKEKIGGGGLAMLILVACLTVIWAPILFPDAWAAYNGS